MTMLRLGAYADVLSDCEWDALICDPPYSARTHRGHDDGVASADRMRDALRRMEARVAAGLPASAAGRVRNDGRDPLAKLRRNCAYAERTGAMKRSLPYASWSEAQCRALIEWAAPRTRGWMVVLCDHVQAPWYIDAMTGAGRYVFAPVVWYAPGSRVRLGGDGPACWVCWIAVSRPRRGPCVRWGSLPGGYAPPQERSGGVTGAHIGGKPIGLMRALVRDYSRRGDVICDPCAGYGTTLRAALAEGRGAIGSEIDPETHRRAIDLLAERVPRVDDDDGQTALF